MMERIRRILWSLWARKKETFIIWFLVFILSAFMTLAYASRMANDDILKRIEENIEVSLNFISPELEGYENNILPGGFDSENHLKMINEFVAEVKNFIAEYGNDSEFVEVYSLALEVNDIAPMGSDNNIYSYDAAVFTDEDYSIKDGRTFAEDELTSGARLCLMNEYFATNGDNMINVGDIIYLGDIDYQVIGIFGDSANRSLLDTTYRYPKYLAQVIIPEEEIFALALQNQKALGLKHPSIIIKGNEIDIQDFKEELSGLINTQTHINADIETNEGISDSLRKPIENVGLIFSFIAYSMIGISFILLFSFVLYLARKRKKEFGILIAMGQSKLLTIGEFLFELLLIANLAFALSIPLSVKMTESISHNMINTNIERQKRIAEISFVDKDYEILNEQENLYATYDLRLSNGEYLTLLLMNNGVIIISSAMVMLLIARIKPKDLLLG